MNDAVVEPFYRRYLFKLNDQNSISKLFAALLGRKKLSTEQIAALKQIVDR